MNTGKISARYAKALLLFAEENGKDSVVYEEMKIVAESFFNVPELRDTLKNPTISKEKKKQLLITAAGTKVSDEYNKFVDLVIEHKREEYFQGISLVFQDMYRKKMNIITSELITATPVDEAEEARLKAAVKAKVTGTVEFKKTVDPDLIGGFILNVETYQLDASIKSQLRVIRNTFASRNSEIAKQ
ncbi:MAG: F0F1 ATP synthase subunit delta [Paludibacteraceae bacterium]|nr:F0F1 ATP synthase subunit delta [Paludibacteraceae bacterium]